jgi:hypothetical protein
MSSNAPPPTGGGNAKYVAVAALLALGIVGLLIFRARSAVAPPVVLPVVDAGAPVATNSHVDDEVPPPPEIPDAGPEIKPKVSNVTPGAVCNATKCSGTPSSDLESALAFRAKQAHACYDQALANDSSLRGRVSINVRIASNGQVCSAAVGANELGSSNVAQCVANKFRQTGYFPSPKGGCIDATVPITFVPGGK